MRPSVRVPHDIAQSERFNLKQDAARLRFLIRHPNIAALLQHQRSIDRIRFIDEQMRKTL